MLFESSSNRLNTMVELISSPKIVLNLLLNGVILKFSFSLLLILYNPALVPIHTLSLLSTNTLRILLVLILCLTNSELL